MSQQSARQAARRAASDAQAVLRKERERRLEGLAIVVLTALGERDALVRMLSRAEALAAALLNLGIAYAGHGDYPAARDSYTQARNHYQATQDVYMGRGITTTRSAEVLESLG
jgi:hypothetical protein